ncbi:MAG TPA: hypothetical protein VKZ53_12965 [Candidatus Angelobacter sp.]|nr:hypothetical protein [Candidatus Angelobacter sp.]
MTIAELSVALDILITTKHIDGMPAFRFSPKSTNGVQFLLAHTTTAEWNSGITVGSDRCAQLCQDAHLEGLKVGEQRSKK